MASSVTVITEEQIQRDQRRTLPDLLATVPGLNVVQTGGPGGQTSVFMRGTNADHVKVLIDGIEVNDPSQPKRQFDFGPLMTDDIERVEVLRGPQSGLYGADAIGGVISITTKKGSGPAKWTATMEGGIVRHLQSIDPGERRHAEYQLRLHRRAQPHQQHAGNAVRRSWRRASAATTTGTTTTPTREKSAPIYRIFSASISSAVTTT